MKIVIKQTTILFNIFAVLILGSNNAVSDEEGLASYYGKKYDGKVTASGELFDMHAYTAAHPSYPFNTILNVTNLENKKSVEVRVNDRATFKEGHVIDLAYDAANSIGILKGSHKVKIEVLKHDEDTTSKLLKEAINPADSLAISMGFYETDITSKKIRLQVASFHERKNAEDFIKKEQVSGYTMKIIEIAFGSLYKVVVICDNKERVKEIKKKNRYKGAYVLKW